MRAAALLVVGIGTITLGACDTYLEKRDQDVPTSGSTLTYDCTNGKVVHAQFNGLDSVTVDYEGATKELRGVLSEEGAKYKTGTTIFHKIGDTAELETDGLKIRCAIRP